eukprot:Skav206517  [mRNA]  locus=scaffold2251:295383:296150:- [translate_table: standard]
MEAGVLKSHCAVALDLETKDAPCAKPGNFRDLNRMEETALVSRARKLDGPEVPQVLGIRDLAWVGSYASSGYTGFQQLVLRWFHPAMFLIFFALLSLTWKHTLVTFAAQPELNDFVVHGGNTSTAFSPDKKHYALLVHMKKPDVTLQVGLDQQDPNTMQMSLKLNDSAEEILQWTAGDKLEQLVNMNSDLYPVEMHVGLNDTSSSAVYSFQFFKYDLVPESVTAWGTRKNGEHFEKCFSWDVLVRHNIMFLPQER